jgi:cysteine-S-conjugate beta-lyase
MGSAFDDTSAFDDISEEQLRGRRTVKWTLHGPDVLPAWVAEMDFPVAPVIRSALIEAIDRGDLGYSPADTSDLSAACAEFLAASYRWKVAPERIFPVADVLAGITGALETFVPPESAVVLPTPAYPPFFEIIGLTGRQVVEVPLVDGPRGPALDLDAVDTALSSGARAVLLCSPQNPTGRVFSTEELAELASIVERYGGRVISDEVHAPLVYPGVQFVPYATVSEAAANHTVTCTSASKAWNTPGLKCAQVITSNHADAAKWRGLPVFAVPGPTSLGISASTVAYRHGRAWLRDVLVYLDGNRHLLAELLASEVPGVRYRVPEATYLAWLDCTELGALGAEDPAAFFLHNARVALNDGPSFGTGFDHHVRLNFGTSQKMLRKIVTAMGRSVRQRWSERGK